MDLLIPILDELAVNDKRIFHSLEQEIRSDPTEHERAMGSSIAFPISEAFTEKLTDRAQEIFREIQRVLGGAYFEDFDELSETLKREWVMRLEAIANIASTQFQNTTQLERESLSFIEAVSEDPHEGVNHLWLAIYADAPLTEPYEFNLIIQKLRIPSVNPFERIFILHRITGPSGGYSALQFFPIVCEFL
jgi:hypothetical protein